VLNKYLYDCYTQKEYNKIILKEFRRIKEVIKPEKIIFNKNNKYFMVIDTETACGFKDPKIVQISWCIFDNNYNIIKERDYIINPEGFIIDQITFNIHKISNEKAELYGYNYKYVYDILFLDMNDIDLIIGHNLIYDINVLLKDFERKKMFKFIDLISKKNKFCTLKHLRKVTGKPYKLKNAYLEFVDSNIDENSLHNSMYDVQCTTKLFQKLISNKLL